MLRAGQGSKQSWMSFPSRTHNTFFKMLFQTVGQPRVKTTASRNRQKLNRRKTRKMKGTAKKISITILSGTEAGLSERRYMFSEQGWGRGTGDGVLRGRWEEGLLHLHHPEIAEDFPSALRPERKQTRVQSGKQQTRLRAGVCYVPGSSESLPDEK